MLLVVSGTLVTLRMRGQVFCRVGARTRATDLIGPDETVGELRARILGDAFAALPGADDVVRSRPDPPFTDSPDSPDEIPANPRPS